MSGSFLKLVFCIYLIVVGSVSWTQAMESDIVFDQESFVPKGKYYDVTVPATLDLAERAKLSVHGLTSFLNPKSTKPPAEYGPYGHTYFNANPPYMSDMPGGPPNWGKIAESILLTRVMSGSKENMDVDAKTFQGMIKYISLHPKAPTPMSRVMLAMQDYYQIAPSDEIRQLIDTMARMHIDAVQRQGELAYWPNPIKDDVEKMLGLTGYGWTAFIQGCAIRPLARWAVMTGDTKSLDIARRAVRYTIQPQFWESEAEPRAVYGPDHGHFYGHHHSYTQALMGLLWYADAANDPHIKAFVRDGYEYMRNFGIARIGLFGEGCTTGNMTWLALKLSEMGVGDFYDDIDCIIRNHLAELQITSADKLRSTVEMMPKNVRGKFEMLKPDDPLDPINESKENIIERNVGIFLGDSTHPTLIPEHTFRDVYAIMEAARVLAGIDEAGR